VAKAIYEEATGAGEHAWESTEMGIVRLEGPVGGSGFSVQQVQDMPAGPVQLHINSGGGCITTGLAIYQALREHPHDVTCEIQNAGSAAVLPALAADHRAILSAGSVFIHQCWGSVVGREADMRAAARQFRRQNALYAAIVAERTGLSLRKVNQLMLVETRLTADQAIGLGFCHEEIADEPQQAPAGPGADLQQTAIAALAYERRRDQTQERQLRAEALPAAMASHAAAPALFPRLFPTLPPGPAGATLDRLFEAEQRMAQIRGALEVRLRRAINCGGRVQFPVRSTWTCSACGQDQYHPPVIHHLATPCAHCGATSTPEEDFTYE